MKLKTGISILLPAIIFSAQSSFAQESNIIQYINTYKLIAVQEMQRTGVPASIKLAQGILETEAGTSELVKRSNNHFGIKCKNNWDGNRVYHDDDARGECFRAYPTAAESYRDHSDFLKGSPRYAFLFQLDPEDYKAWAYGLKKAGYATNPKYTQQLIQYIEDYDLQTFTLIALGKKPWSDTAEFVVNNQNDPNQSGFSSVAPIEVHPGENGSQEDSAVAVDYPQGEFRINETKVVYAPAGSSLLALADQYSVKYKHILEFNELHDGDDILVKPQLVYIQRKRKQGANEFHIVKKYESVYDIAQAEGIRLENLLSYNMLQEGMRPAAGEKLFLKGFAEQRPALQTTVNAPPPPLATNNITAKDAKPGPVKHIVQSKETLYSIARKYDVKADQIREWNNLNSPDLRIGQELLIYKN
ncbi:MAG: hypothetical protein C5B52_12875 [Bacteroidetes bacterium]|nr:MAG: hypothetical protein C5B52_12875 [Bacteroidota bacterium]